ncbi:MAG: V-type ATPase subunit, partial [Candidatus Diapherotrites archaeon]|nr:V-type ATPase subunit [Candidatus Diapherotrites archaeon]
GKYSGESPDIIKASTMDLNDPKVNISELLDENVSIEEVLEKTGIIRNCPRMVKSVKRFQEENSLFYIENCLDWYYYGLVINFAKRIPAQEKYIRKFIENEVEALNIKIMLKMKRENFSKEEILKNIIHYKSESGKQKIWRDLIEAEDIESVFELLSKTNYRSVIEQGVEVYKKSNKLSTIESGLEKHILEQAYLLLHQHPLSISPIIGYVIAKRVEMKNLGMLARSKEVGLDEEFIHRHLVIAGA